MGSINDFIYMRKVLFFRLSIVFNQYNNSDKCLERTWNDELLTFVDAVSSPKKQNWKPHSASVIITHFRTMSFKALSAHFGPPVRDFIIRRKGWYTYCKIFVSWTPKKEQLSLPSNFVSCSPFASLSSKMSSVANFLKMCVVTEQETIYRHSIGEPLKSC